MRDQSRSHVQFVATPGTVTRQAPLCIAFQIRILEWAAISSSRGSFWPRDQTRISCIADGFFTTEPPGKPLSFFLLPLSAWDFSLLLCVILSYFRDPFHFVNTTHSFVCSKVNGYLGNWHFSLNAENAAMSIQVCLLKNIFAYFCWIDT